MSGRASGGLQARGAASTGWLGPGRQAGPGAAAPRRAGRWPVAGPPSVPATMPPVHRNRVSPVTWDVTTVRRAGSLRPAGASSLVAPVSPCCFVPARGSRRIAGRARRRRRRPSRVFARGGARPRGGSGFARGGPRPLPTRPPAIGARGAFGRSCHATTSTAPAATGSIGSGRRSSPGDFHAEPTTGAETPHPPDRAVLVRRAPGAFPFRRCAPAGRFGMLQPVEWKNDASTEGIPRQGWQRALKPSSQAVSLAVGRHPDLAERAQNDP